MIKYLHIPFSIESLVVGAVGTIRDSFFAKNE
jgi:hypothetical protein